MTTDELIGELTATTNESLAEQQDLLTQKQEKLNERTDKKASDLGYDIVDDGVDSSLVGNHDRQAYRIDDQGRYIEQSNKVYTPGVINNDDDMLAYLSYLEGNKVVDPSYEGKTRALYQFAANDGKSSKFGLSLGYDENGSLIPAKARYVEGLVKGYGWNPGPKGVNPDENFMDIPMDYRDATIAEGALHDYFTRAGYRTNMRKPGEVGFDQQTIDDYGSGKSEYYQTDKLFSGRTEKSYDPAWMQKRGEEIYNELAGRKYAALDEDNSTDWAHRMVGDSLAVGGAQANGYIENTAKAFGSAVAGSLYGIADTVTELAGSALSTATGGAIGDNWDLGTEDERSRAVNDWIGYDDTRSAKSMAIISDEAKKMWDKGELNSDGLWKIAKTAFTDADTFMYSLGTLATWVVGGEVGVAAKGAKALKMAKTARAAGDVEKATEYLAKAKKYRAKANELSTATKFASKAASLYTKDAGFNSAVLSATNDDIDEFKKNNHGEIGMDDIARMALINYANLGLDKFTGIKLMKLDPEAVEGFRAIGRAMGEKGREVVGKKLTAMATHGTKESAKLVKSMGVEGAQEYVQTMGELFNVQYGTDKYGDDAGKILTDDKNIIEGLTAASAGAAGGAQFHAIGAAKAGIKAAGKGFADNQSKFNPERTEFNTKWSADAARNASVDELKNVKTPEAKVAHTKLIMNDAAATMDNIELVPEGKDYSDHITDTVKSAVDKLAAVNDISTDEAKTVLTGNVISKFLRDQGKDYDTDEIADVVNAATKGMDEKQKEVVTGRVVASVLKNAQRQFNDALVQHDIELDKDGVATTKLTDEQLQVAKDAVDTIKKLGSSFDDGGKTAEVAKALEKEIKAYVAADKSVATVEKEIFDTGFSIVGKFGSTTRKSMKQHVEDITADMVNPEVSVDQSPEVRALEGFIDTRGANKVAKVGKDGTVFNEHQQLSMANTTIRDNDRIGVYVDRLIEQAEANGVTDYAEKLKGMKATLLEHNKELKAKRDALIEATGGSVKRSGNSKRVETSIKLDHGLSTDLSIMNGSQLQTHMKQIVDMAKMEGTTEEFKKVLRERYKAAKVALANSRKDTKTPEKQVVKEVPVETVVEQVPEVKDETPVVELTPVETGSVDYSKMSAKELDAEADRIRNTIRPDMSTEEKVAISGKAEELSKMARKLIADSKKSSVEDTVEAEKLLGDEVLDVKLGIEYSKLRSQYEVLSDEIANATDDNESDIDSTMKAIKVRDEVVQRMAEIEYEARLKAIAKDLKAVFAMNVADSVKENARSRASMLKREALGMKGDFIAEKSVSERTKKLMAQLEIAIEKGNEDRAEKVRKQLAKGEEFLVKRKTLASAKRRKMDANDKNVIELEGVNTTEDEKAELKALADAENAVEEVLTETEREIDKAYKMKAVERNKIKKEFRAKIKKMKAELADMRKAKRMEFRTARKNVGKKGAVSRSKAIWRLLLDTIKELRQSVKMVKAAIESKYAEMKIAMDWSDTVIDGKIRRLEAKANELYKKFNEAEGTRKAAVMKAKGKYSVYSKTASYAGMANNELFELVKPNYKTDSSIFDREESVGSLLNISKVLSLGLLPKSMTAKINNEIKKGADAVLGNGSMFGRVARDLGIAKSWISNGAGKQVKQEKVVRIGEDTRFSKEEKAAIDAADIVVNTDANGIKHVELIGKDGKKLDIEGAEVNPLVLLTTENGTFSKEFMEVVAAESLQMIAGMIDAKNKTGAEMEQFITGTFGIDPKSPLFESTRKMLMDGIFPEASFIQSAGRNVLKLAGIKLDSNLDIDQTNALIAGVGQIVVENLKNVNKSSTTIDGKSFGEVSVMQAGLVKVDPIKGDIDYRLIGEKAPSEDFKANEGKTYRILKVDFNGKGTETMLNQVAGTMEYLGTGGKSRRASLEPLGKHEFGKKLIRGTSTLAAEQDVEYLNQQETTPRTFNKTFKMLEKAIVASGKDPMDYEAWYDMLLESYEDIEKLPALEREIALINRRAGEHEVNGILDTRFEVGDNEFYLPWDVTSSDRYMIDSNVINPQNGKISRFLVAIDGMRSKLEWGENGFNQDDVDLFLAAASQSLGMDIDKAPDAMIIDEMREEYFSMGTDGKIEYADSKHGKMLKGWVADYRNGKLPDMSSENYKERMHALQLVAALAEIEANPGKTVEHELVIEMDGITNGMMMTLLQIGTDKAMELLGKGGIYYKKMYENGGMPFDHSHVLKPLDGSEGLRDIYSTPVPEMERHINEVARGSVEKLRNMVKNKPSKLSAKEARLFQNAENALKGQELMLEMFDTFGPGSNRGVWRKMMKPLVMVYIYGAQMTSIRKNVGHDFGMFVLDKGLKEFRDLSWGEMLLVSAGDKSAYKAAKGIAVKNLGEKATDAEIKAEIKAIKERAQLLVKVINRATDGKPTFKVFDNEMKIDVDAGTGFEHKMNDLYLTQDHIDVISDDMSGVMSDSIEHAFTENFGFIDDYREALKSVEMVNYMLFKTELKEKLAKYVNDDGVLMINGDMLTEIFQELDKEGKSYGAINSRGAIQDYKKFDSKDKGRAGVTGTMADGSTFKPVTKTVTTKSKEVVANPGATGVTAIHDMDGFLMYLTRENGFQNIFDAYVAGLDMKDIRETSDSYNKNVIDLSRRHSILHNAHGKVAKQLAEMKKNRPELYKKMIADMSGDEKEVLVDAFKRINKKYGTDNVFKVVKTLNEIDGQRNENINGDVRVGHLHVSTKIAPVDVTADTTVNGKKIAMADKQFGDSSDIVEVLINMIDAINGTVAKAPSKVGFTLTGNVAHGKKGGKDYAKAQNVNAYIGHPREGKSSTGMYLKNAIDQGIPVNSGILADSNTVAFVSVNGGGTLTEENFGNTIRDIENVLNNGGRVLMDNDKVAKEAQGAYNLEGEGKVQDELLRLGYEKHEVVIEHDGKKFTVNEFYRPLVNRNAQKDVEEQTPKPEANGQLEDDKIAEIINRFAKENC